ncbi:MAG: hypothetical protein K2Q12_08395 [Rickettsiales bacterium]|nr:hypothetical protein [Rickettsiales bacterium]
MKIEPVICSAPNLITPQGFTVRLCKLAPTTEDSEVLKLWAPCYAIEMQAKSLNSHALAEYAQQLNDDYQKKGIAIVFQPSQKGWLMFGDWSQLEAAMDERSCAPPFDGLVFAKMMAMKDQHEKQTQGRAR